MRKTALVLAVAALMTFAACRVHLGGPGVHGRIVVVPHGHICIAACTHYFHGGHWYVAHRHGLGCGHHLHEGRWLVLAAAATTPVVAVSSGHACTPMCSHYWHNGVWHAGHQHGANCGHILQGTKWIVTTSVPVKEPAVVAGHKCTAACTHYFHNGSWMVGHRHGPNCGHVLRGNKWMVVVGATPAKPPQAGPPASNPSRGRPASSNKPPQAGPPASKPPRARPRDSKAPAARPPAPAPAPPPQAKPPKEDKDKGKGQDKDKDKGKGKDK